MKKISTLVAFLICFFSLAKAQTNYCKDIVRTINDMKADTTYESPIIKRTQKMQLSKNPQEPFSYVIFTLTQENANYDVKGVYVKFEDGTIINNSIPVDCTYLNSDDHYLFTGAMRLDEDNTKLFLTKKVVKYQIDNVDVPIDDAFATKFKAWANCIVNIK